MNLKSITTFAVSLALATALAVPAFADGNDANHPKAVFPMPAAEFQQKVEGHLARRQAKLEKIITEKNIPADKANEMRTHFNDKAAATRAAAAAAESDGTVTADEAKIVREAGGWHHGHHKDGQQKKA
jgi:hypothetical protein